jgi:indolepyruvate ferredoxin oxidoreductase beta subunit
MTDLRKDPFNLIIAGVGGQGNILASQVVAQAALMEDLNATIGETYGVSQRGGSVMSHVRMTAGTPVGPLIPQGAGDLLVGFEPIETFQVAMDFGNAKIRVILNPRPVYPIGVLSGDLTYPSIDQILDLLKQHVADLKTLPATEIAKEAGEIRAMNVVMVGALAATGLLPMKKESYLKALRDQFRGPALEINQRAFEKGYEASLSAHAQ